ncbi:hypothetical protein Dsin_024346 [Dipteronia sinensis]|uniref:Uncharacterized protein n=1 Tax=Dipteronia sinensis TaxID=43782 RepID=A0AAE0DW62_9ROSI|nr:hypothetical protein Dsin_024346 [Dipteronia sinensis]
MLATFLLIVGHNNGYCLVRDTFGRSHFTVSINFNKVLKALNTIALDILARPGSLPSKLRESTRTSLSRNEQAEQKGKVLSRSQMLSRFVHRSVAGGAMYEVKLKKRTPPESTPGMSSLSLVRRFHGKVRKASRTSGFWKEITSETKEERKVVIPQVSPWDPSSPVKEPLHES